MPKEITHWLVAERSAAALPDGRLGTAARACPNALCLGAVYPDVPYYLTGDSPPARLAEQAAAEYHDGRAAWRNRLPGRLLAALREGDDPALGAFLVGVLSHLQADRIFHPLVYHLTGDYHDPDPRRRSVAVRDHRRLEGLIDLQLCAGGERPLQGYRVRACWERRESPHLLARVLAGEPTERAAALSRALQRFLRTQALFLAPAVRRLAALAHPLLPAAGQELTALFYPPGQSAGDQRLAAPLAYRHPHSGAAQCATLDQLLEGAVTATLAACRLAEATLAGEKAAAFAPEPDGGTDAGPAAHPQFFADPPFFAPR